MPEKILITTSIPYVNAEPHIGFALELVQADAAARRARLAGDRVFFLTGADENGLKNYTAAQKQEITVQELVDRHSALFQKLAKKLNLSHDNFIRTSAVSHHQTAQEFWKKLAEAGDIYLKKYQALYCVGCESFVLPRDLTKGKCAHHNQEPEKVAEENYFFKLSRYRDRIYQAVKGNKIKVAPESRKNELLNLIQDAEDVSFSRPASKLPWGVKVPDEIYHPTESGIMSHSPPSIHHSHTMYVWCDALTNYISGLPGKSFVEKTASWNQQDKIIHLIGKDILRFHGSIWIGMLLSAGLRLPDEVRVHGFISFEGKKMSKSLGNVANPLEYIRKYGADAVRFYLLKEIPEYGDGDWSEKRFIEVYNSLLANELGNLTQRTITLLVNLKSQISNLKTTTKNSKLDSLEKIWGEVRWLNEFISQERLWEKGKEKELAELRQKIYQIAIALEPYLPETSEKILEQLKTLKPEVLFPRIK